MTTYLGKSCSFGLQQVPFVNCCQFMYLVISLWFWEQDMESDCIGSWSLLLIYLTHQKCFEKLLKWVKLPQKVLKYFIWVKLFQKVLQCWNGLNSPPLSKDWNDWKWLNFTQVLKCLKMVKLAQKVWFVWNGLIFPKKSEMFEMG